MYVGESKYLKQLDFVFVLFFSTGMTEKSIQLSKCLK